MVAVALLAGRADAASAEAPPLLRVQVIYASSAQTAVDPRLAPLSRRLAELFDFTEYRLEADHRLTAALGGPAAVPLPGGRQLRLTPAAREAAMWKIALAIPGLVQTELSIRDGHMVILGGTRHEAGVLILAIEINPPDPPPVADAPKP